MKSAEETTGARIVCVQRRVTRRHSRSASARVERHGFGSAKRAGGGRRGEGAGCGAHAPASSAAMTAGSEVETVCR